MGYIRRVRWSWRTGTAAVVAAAALAGCTPAVSPTVTPSPVAPSSASPDYTQPGAARAALRALQSAAGARPAIKVDITRTRVELVVLEQNTAKTWAWRDGKAVQVDGDTQYVGQTTFNPDDYALDDVAALFTQAADVSGSRSGQELQVVEYSPGRVYMTATTSPESQTVFFTRDGALVSTLNLTSADGLRSGLADAVDERPALYAISINPSVGVTADGPGTTPAGQPGILRATRAPKYPTRTEIRSDKPATPLTFDPGVVDPGVLATLLARYAGPNHSLVTATIDRRDGLSEPTIRISVDGRVVVCDLAGNDITATVRR